MSALHSIKKRMRHLTPKEQFALDARIVVGTYQSSRKEIGAANKRMERFRAEQYR